MNVRSQKIFMIGIGGMGMAPLAVYLAGEGHDVRGWDDGLTEVVRRILAREGVRISRDAEFPEDADVLVYSSAIASSHPILRRACEAGVPTLKRGEMLAQQAKGRRLVAIVGSHGKTTTAAMIAHILNGQGFKAGFVGGGLFNDDSLPPAWNSSGKWLVAEIDETKIPVVVHLWILMKVTGVLSTSRPRSPCLPIWTGIILISTTGRKICKIPLDACSHGQVDIYFFRSPRRRH